MDKLIGFGASSMEGVGDSQGGFLRRLERKLIEAGMPHECLNHGIGGHTTRDMLDRLDRVRPSLPAKTIVLLGCNDLPREHDGSPQIRVALEDYSRNVEILLGLLGGPDAIFVSSFAVCPNRTGVRTETFARYMDSALKIAQRHGMFVWDLHAESRTLGDRYLAADGLHYDDAGHEMIAERLAAIIVNRPAGAKDSSGPRATT